ncbi:uncharacterized protein EMH_0025830 [Eimeria mitis]|uniref:Uncharacterized protein n=1 Tax=Eimeria mitis TaxID=44415 RepID=U6KBL8_9EIME|nr:uncharacterized protein EMH_0025830 [Eimeria mitis]CDJ35400.1 hypothetical protein EMH_0025830 [Eimeria mitis]
MADRAMFGLVWMWENLFMGTKTSDEPLETTTTEALSFPVKSFVPVRPPAVSELLATSAATVIAATSSPSRSNTNLGLHVYPQQHEKDGRHFKQGAVYASTQDREAHSKAPQLDELTEEAPAATRNGAAVTPRKVRPSQSPSGNLNRLSVPSRQP